MDITHYTWDAQKTTQQHIKYGRQLIVHVETSKKLLSQGHELWISLPPTNQCQNWVQPCLSRLHTPACAIAISDQLGWTCKLCDAGTAPNAGLAHASVWGYLGSEWAGCIATPSWPEPLNPAENLIHISANPCLLIRILNCLPRWVIVWAQALHWVTTVPRHVTLILDHTYFWPGVPAGEHLPMLDDNDTICTMLKQYKESLYPIVEAPLLPDDSC